MSLSEKGWKTPVTTKGTVEHFRRCDGRGENGSGFRWLGVRAWGREGSGQLKMGCSGKWYLRRNLKEVRKSAKCWRAQQTGRNQPRWNPEAVGGVRRPIL